MHSLVSNGWTLANFVDTLTNLAKAVYHGCRVLSRGRRNLSIFAASSARWLHDGKQACISLIPACPVAWLRLGEGKGVAHHLPCLGQGGDLAKGYHLH
jgi:hypothetical protein